MRKHLAAHKRRQMLGNEGRRRRLSPTDASFVHRRERVTERKGHSQKPATRAAPDVIGTVPPHYHHIHHHDHSTAGGSTA